MVEVTRLDRDAAEAWRRDYGRKASYQDLLQAFARHRIAALERAAKVADRHDTGDCTREDMEARRIAEAIRNLKGSSNA